MSNGAVKKLGTEVEGDGVTTVMSVSCETDYEARLISQLQQQRIHMMVDDDT